MLTKTVGVYTTCMLPAMIFQLKSGIPLLQYTKEKKAYTGPVFSTCDEGMGVLHITGRRDLLEDLVREYTLKVVYWSLDREKMLLNKK